MTDQDKRLLTEFLGECWHEPDATYKPLTDDTFKCLKCQVINARRLDFTDWRVVGRLIEKAEDVEVWYYYDGMEWCARVLELETHSAKSPQEAICAAVLAWLKEGGK